MPRHPIYLVLCLGAAGYLALANARGWSFWQSTAGKVFGSAARAGSFHHK